MTDIPDNVRDKLSRIIDYLDMRIKEENSVLQDVRPKDRKTSEEMDIIRPITEPIVRTIIAYTNAREQVYKQFPDLKRE